MPIDARSLLRASAAGGSNSSSSSSSSRTGAIDSHAGAGSAGKAAFAGAITERFASYHPKSRMLRCTACDFQPVRHESLWVSHTASKSHRANVQAIRRQEAERAREREEGAESGQGAGATAAGNATAAGKRKQVGGEDGSESDGGKRSRREDDAANADASIDPLTRPDAQIDMEWERFQAEVLGSRKPGPETDPYTAPGATIEVQPVMRSGGSGEIDDESDGDADQAQGETEEESPEEKRARLEREEREDILARLEEEQRLQEEADERASALRSRFEAMRRARAARKKA